MFILVLSSDWRRGAGELSSSSRTGKRGEPEEIETAAAPVAFLAARNTTPSARTVRPLALLLIVASRSINSLIWGLLLVTIIGPGVLAGVIAIALRSIGFVAKLLYEAIEEIDESQVDAITATGASSLQKLRQANKKRLSN
jgi:phosphonate transport system permease protein